MAKIKVKRLRNSHACLNCQIKKVKCDSKDGSPCTNCVEAGNICRLVKLSGRKRRRGVLPDSFLPYPYFLQSPPMVPNNINNGSLAAINAFHHKDNQYNTESTPDDEYLSANVNNSANRFDNYDKEQVHQYQLISPPYHLPPQQYQPRPYLPWKSRVQYPWQYQYDPVNRTSPQVQATSLGMPQTIFPSPMGHGNESPQYLQSDVTRARSSQEQYMSLHRIPSSTINVEYNPQISKNTSYYHTNYNSPVLGETYEELDD